MPFFFCKLVPPRPTFAQDLSDREREAMLRHVAFWQAAIDRGVRVFALGPVQEPAAVYGIIVMEMADESAVRALAAQDPALAAGIGMHLEIHPMPRGVMHN